MNRRMKLIFTVSILLNILFAGVAAGMLFKYCRDVPIPGDLSPEARHYVARTFQEGRKEAEPLIRDVKARRAKVETLLTGDDFDVAAYAREVDGLLGAQDKIHRHRAATMQKAVEHLSPEDRKKFSRRIVESLEGRRPGRGGHHGKKHKERGDENRDSGAVEGKGK